MWAVPAMDHAHSTPRRTTYRVEQGALWQCSCGRGYEVTKVTHAPGKASKDGRLFYWLEWTPYIGPLEVADGYIED